MKYLFPAILILLLSCEGKKKIEKEEYFIPYYISEVGWNGVKGYVHWIFIGAYSEERDSLLINQAEEYKNHLKTKIPVSSINFIIDTAQFPKDYDEQHWDRIRASICMDIMYEYRPGMNDFQKMTELGWWKDGKRYKSTSLSK